MRMAIHRVEDPDLKTIELGAVYSTHATRTGEPWVLYKISDACGVDSIEPLEIPDGWDAAHEYEMADGDVWARIVQEVHDADLVGANLEIAVVPILDEGVDTESRALLIRFSWPY